MTQSHKQIINAMIRFLKTQTKKRGFSRVVYGLSGGLDSAIVGRLSQMAFGKNATALLMPTSLSSKENLQDARDFTNHFDIPHHIISLSDYEPILQKYPKMSKERFGNLCARLRMMILYDYSAQEHALVVGTSNKTERILGYGTIYGDLAYAINPIGNFYKTELFELAHHLEIPHSIIHKKPSADLFEGQTDEEDLGFSYQEIDHLLQKIEERKLNLYKTDVIFDMIRGEFSQSLLSSVLTRISKNSFKNKGPSIFTSRTHKSKESAQ
ncbi:NAD(+) synthase [Helicobacter enhydrae]|uniref:NH(3)-dependent NAD(+) synthetase n=1 Tax=Helicobacter enhydrae TaxID=222136 RepID=A0A1B1U7J6_9HELI|nr:NAD+ synthase [Helicobacter enhydrae]ANV98739.1 NAD(+) synthase [Helicobacter enhydrae]